MTPQEAQAAGLDGALLKPTGRDWEFTEQQMDAIEQLLEFIQDPMTFQWYFVFRGYAGTGKTSCMEEVARRAANSRVKFVYTAPTNKAAKVLREIVGEACTIYSLLGLRVDKNGETKQVVGGKPVDLSDLDVIVIDEASMINAHLFDLLRDAADKWSLKVIFMGDPAQLPPVKENESMALQGPNAVELTDVKRHDNQILELVTEIRKVIWSPAPSINIRSNNDGHEGVWKLDKNSFKRQIFSAAAAGEFADGRTSKIIAWRNVRVGEYNNIARHAIYGAEAQPGFYLPGDRIVAAGPCERGDVQIMSTDDEAIVESFIECKHPIEPRYHAIELKVRTEDNRVERLLVVHPVSLAQWQADCEMLAHEARANPKLWKRYWEAKDIFHDIRYAYALTAHRSQGSTYTNAYVDYQDVLYNRNRREAFQCLYVAASRARKCLYLA